MSAVRPVVGWIGLGDQGAPMARAIAEAGEELHVWARRAASLEVLGDVPFVAHDTPVELARASDIVAVCLNTDDDVRDVMLTRGLLAAMKPGSVLVNHGTGLPSFAQEMTETAAPYGVAVLDAPVSGGHAGAVDRQLTTIVGGDAAAVEKCLPVFQTFSAKIASTGGPGTGQMAKLINNALLMANQESLVQMLRVANGIGVETGPLVDVLRAGTATSQALESLGSAITPENAQHLRKMQLVDMEIFTEAVAQLGDAARPLIDRAVDGAQALPELAEQIR